jgi:hypothetical protein
MIDEIVLRNLYVENKASMMEIATSLGCSVHKIEYWMDKHKIKRRTISEAIYQKHNPNGDPFIVKRVTTKRDHKLLGIGLGLYWGEGTKADKYSIRLGNSDPALLRMFMMFLIELFGIEKDDLRFGLQIFTDINPDEALGFWTRELDVKSSQFYKVIVTISGSLGTYRKKSLYGVATVHYHNKKLRDIVVNMLPR